ncbi:Wzz/FepE/Etk N-terminal domain-containing protein [Sphingomonas sp. KR1UV-12]|uniref:Wzz/FepE/Etk N-terminal domain-containing protein n=1 Tax=Sphingomonas aurea TaxID=3063994 RepID=A0ABT9EIB0_9SPHN|nr:Wzz/FepE/Etk N-terminal domain-containing protein [Sphingomonas sp. KR1UV-12]MDP1026688.1 Wzz/FepE/Etk N-terminal domain-containing protein [Sphingomonas sp. KR1UV-12]
MTSLSDILAVLRSRIRLVATISGLTMLLVLALALVQPRAYTAGASLIVTPRTDEAFANPQAIEAIIGTQIDILRSDAVLREVIRRDPAFRRAGDQQGGTQTALQDLRRQFVAAAEKGSNVIKLSYTARSPVDAARVLNLIGDIYLETQGDLKTTAAQREQAFFAKRTQEARTRLEAAQRALTEAQQRSGMVGTTRMDLDAQRMSNLSSELVRAQADAAQASSRAGSSRDPSVAQSEIVQNLERDLSQQASKVAQLARDLGPNHPTMKAAEAQLASLRASLASARASQTNALGSASRSAGRRVAEIQGELAQQQGRLLQSADVQDRINVLQRDVDAARDGYDAVRKRLNQVDLQSRSAQADATRLDRATPPRRASAPSLVAWGLAALVLGAMVGPMTALVLELYRPRVRSTAGTARALQMDVIVDMTQPRMLTQSSQRLLGSGA